MGYSWRCSHQSSRGEIDGDGAVEDEVEVEVEVVFGVWLLAFGTVFTENHGSTRPRNPGVISA